MKLFKTLKNQKGFTTFSSHERGFTLIELLVVIGILAVLLAITLIAINPARQFAQANNTKRRSDVNAILNAVNQYMADNKGLIPPGGIPVAPAAALNIQDATAGGADICAAIVPTYIAALPSDPQVNSGTGVGAAVVNCAQVGGYNTGYTIIQSANNRITVGTTITELSDPVSVTR